MIKSMHLVNIQSWKDETIEFSEDLVNVISARSEKGKTVLFKVFYQMVFPNYYKFNSRNDLIRRGCYFGEVTLELTNFTQILFHLEHKEQWFKMKRPCDEDWITYYQSNCPNEIINELGLIVDYELQYILNIYIKDNQYPFINTTKTWNAVLFNQVFKNEKLDKTVEFLTTELKDLSDLKKRLESQLSYKNLQNSQLTYTDVEDIDRVKNTVNSINQCYDVIDEISKVMLEYEKHLKTYEELKDKVFDVVDIMDVKELYTSINAIKNVTVELEPNLSVVQNTPDYTDIGREAGNIKKLVETVSDIYSNSQRVENQLIDYSNSVSALTRANEIKDTVKSMHDISALVGKIHLKFKDMDNRLITHAKVCDETNKVSKELEEVKSKIKICPTCKRPL